MDLQKKSLYIFLLSYNILYISPQAIVARCDHNHNYNISKFVFAERITSTRVSEYFIYFSNNSCLTLKDDNPLQSTSQSTSRAFIATLLHNDPASWRKRLVSAWIPSHATHGVPTAKVSLSRLTRAKFKFSLALPTEGNPGRSSTRSGNTQIAC